MPVRLVFIGPPGAGKTTVGSLVAGSLGLPFRDADAEVEAAAGKPVGDIFIDDGEPHFRVLEEEAVATVLASGDGVVALGGGAVLSERTQSRLAGHTVVYLSVELPEAAARVGLNRDRPLLLGNPRGRLRELLAQRVPVYERLATVRVSTDGRTPEQVRDDVLAVIRR
ncbi:MAG: shikimate kinase [Actinobacteria bacterium]|nr:shikimate kinase [Actinomycetota bacterium]